MDVVEHDHHGPFLGGDLYESPDSPEGLLRRSRGAGQADQVRDALGDPFGVFNPTKAGGDGLPSNLGIGFRWDVTRPPHHLAHRPVRDALPIGETPPPEDDGPSAQAGDGLLGQARLAHASGSQHGEQVARPFPSTEFEGLLEQAQLAGPPHDRRDEVPARP